MKARVLVKLDLNMEMGSKHTCEEKAAQEGSNSRKHKI